MEGTPVHSWLVRYNTCPGSCRFILANIDVISVRLNIVFTSFPGSKASKIVPVFLLVIIHGEPNKAALRYTDANNALIKSISVTSVKIPDIFQYFVMLFAAKAVQLCLNDI